MKKTINELIFFGDKNPPKNKQSTQEIKPHQ